MSRFCHILVLLAFAGTATAAGPAGNALRFDGAQSFTLVPDSASLDVSSGATWELWLAPDDNPLHMRLIQKGDGLHGGSDRAYEIGISPAAAGPRGFGANIFLGSSTYLAPFVPWPMTPGRWVHLAMTYDLVTGKLKTYINGSLAGTMTTTLALPIRNSSMPLAFGAAKPNFGLYFEGTIDEVRIWNVARTPTEIGEHFNCRVSPDTPGLVGYWRFDEPVGEQRILDASPFGNDGTLGPTLSVEPSDPMRVVSTAPILPFGGLAAHYAADTLCSNSTVPGPGLLNFTFDGIAPEFGCDGSLSSRLFAGTIGQNQFAKITRIQQDCTIQPFGALICRPESVLIDTTGVWPGVCGQPNLILAGGRCDDGFDRVYVLDPTNGSICQTFVDNTLGRIGQMALNGAGDLFVGTIDGDCLHALTGGVVVPFLCAPGQSLRAVAVDENDNVYVTGSADGIMRMIAPDGTVLNSNFASGLEGAVSQAFAPPGIFHGNLFVTAGDRVIEVDLATGQTSEFFGCSEAHGIAFDPEGFMYVSSPSEDRILRVGPGLPGDMDGSGATTLDDVPGFVAALLKLPDAPLPIITADINEDGCADGADISGFVAAVLGT